jgi:hypothetical protein
MLNRNADFGRRRLCLTMVAVLCAVTITLPASVGLANNTVRAALPASQLTCRVDAGGGGNYTTLQAAVDDFSCGQITLTATSGRHVEFGVTISRDVEISGAGANRPTLDAERKGLPIKILAGATVVLRNLVVTNGSNNVVNTWGGNIQNAGQLTLQDCLIQNGSSFVGAGLGNTGALTIDDCSIEGNVAAYVGAMYNGGTLTITHSFIGGNRAENVPGLGNYLGHVLIIDSTIAENDTGGRDAKAHLSECAGCVANRNANCDPHRRAADTIGIQHAVGQAGACAYLGQKHAELAPDIPL